MASSRWRSPWNMNCLPRSELAHTGSGYLSSRDYQRRCEVSDILNQADAYYILMESASCLRIFRNARSAEGRCTSRYSRSSEVIPPFSSLTSAMKSRASSREMFSIAVHACQDITLRARIESPSRTGPHRRKDPGGSVVGSRRSLELQLYLEG